MAYENVNVESAKRAINNCLEDIKQRHTASDNILSTLPGSSEWVADSKATFLSAVDKLVNTRYDELTKYLNKCLTALDNIQQYKDLQSKAASYSTQIAGKTSAVIAMETLYIGLSDKTTDSAKKMKKDIDKLKQDIKELERLKNNSTSSMSKIDIDI